MSVYDSILVAVDGSEPADTAARQAVHLANAFDASLSVVSAVQEHSFSFLPGEEPDGDLVLDESASESVQELEARANEAGVPCRTVVERGAAHEVISAYVDQLDADLVTMGTHGRTGLDRLLLGSTADRTIRTSEVPVLTTPPLDESAAVDSVLIPTDGSDCAERAADHGIAVARRFDATVHALSAVNVQAIAAAYETGPAIPTVIEDLEAGHRDAVAAVTERAAAHDLDTVEAVPQGPPAQLITEYVDDEGIDLVAMGTHGRSGLKRHLVGSVAERAVRTSDAPVLAVPP
jgi:nucleotide-binding universal stress UspA family protein